VLDQLFVSLNDAALHLAERWVPVWMLPWLSILVRVAAIAAVAPVIMMYFTWLERKILARMQNRFGPNRVGIYGLAQPLADGLKMLIKEDVVPRSADPLLHVLAPILVVIPAILLFAVMPFGRNMVAVDLHVGLLYMLAISSVSSYAIFMGGWSSHSKFSLLGAMRAVAQIISYEVPSVLSVVVVIMVTGTLSLVGIVEAQADQWFVFTPWGFVGAVIFFLSGIAEVNRTPFDMPEAESELVAGFHTEYSGMKFALWYMGEFLGAFAISAFTATLFLGGWQGPVVPIWPLCLATALVVATARGIFRPVRMLLIVVPVGAAVVWAREPVPSWLWFFGKTYLLVFVLIWLRGTFPRLRIDQLMGLAWKFFLPLSLLNILAAGVWVAFPGFPGMLGSLALLAISVVGLIRLSAPASLQPRTYVLVE